MLLLCMEFLFWLCMMVTNTMDEGKPKNAMYAMLLPSISNLTLDYIFTKDLLIGV